MNAEQRHANLSSIAASVKREGERLIRIAAWTDDEDEKRLIWLAVDGTFSALRNIRSAQSATKEHLARTLEQSVTELPEPKLER